MLLSLVGQDLGGLPVFVIENNSGVIQALKALGWQWIEPTPFAESKAMSPNLTRDVLAAPVGVLDFQKLAGDFAFQLDLLEVTPKVSVRSPQVGSGPKYGTES